MSDPCLTPAEWANVRAYDQLCTDQIKRDQEYAERPLKKPSLGILLNALEKAALEEIRDLQEEIGLLMKCRETFNDRASVENTNVLIWQLRYGIEESHNDITRWRSYAKELGRV